ncbi:hypothetical protein Pan110_59350 [Gimesia panareensis]|nr:hypothetical protein Pan110_59350 [Gimesia panareensis]
MIAPVRPNNHQPSDDPESVTQQDIEVSKHLLRAEQLLKSTGEKSPYDDLAFAIIFIIATSGALLLGKLISIIVKNAT